MRVKIPAMIMVPASSLVALAACSGAALALSTTGSGDRNPWPSVSFFIVVIALLICVLIAEEWATRRVVEGMRKDHDVEGLIGALKNAWLARRAACALGDIKDETAVEPLMEALHDTNSCVRQAAAKALGNIGDDRAIEPLTAALGDEYRNVRDCASYALQKIRKPGMSGRSY